jgi:hypothetical protein
MFSAEKIKFAKDVLWDGLSFKHSSDDVRKMAIAAYPSLSGVDGFKTLPSYEVMGLIAKNNIEDAKDLLNVLAATEPDVLALDDGKPFYSFEMVGGSIIALRRVLEEGLKAGTVSQDDYLSIYQQIAGFAIFKSGNFDHNFLHAGHLKTLFQYGKFDAFESVYKVFSQKGESQAWSVFCSVKDVLKPFYEGRMSLHNEVMAVISNHADLDRYSVVLPAELFWKKDGQLIDFLTASNDKALWKEGIRMSTEIFGLHCFHPLKAAVRSGLASLAIKGQVAIFLAAKRQGYVFDLDEIRQLICPIERLAKSIGTEWTRKVPDSIGSGITEVIAGVDKKLLLSGKRSKNLIESLNELMPNQGWMNFAAQKDKKSILMNQLDM